MENLTTGGDAIGNSNQFLVSISTFVQRQSVFRCHLRLKDQILVSTHKVTFVTVVQKQVGDRRAFINKSIGEGAVWVTNINGNLRSGDYITTSNVAGYVMRTF